MSNQTENEKLAQAYRYGWQAAIKCLQDVYKNGVNPLAEILVLEDFKKNLKPQIISYKDKMKQKVANAKASTSKSAVKKITLQNE